MIKLTARTQAWILGAVIALGTVVGYLPVLRGGFVWDDDDHVTQNETLVDLQGLRRIWLERGAVPQYYPLVHTSFWIERHLWGLDPAGYHATNVILHALAAVLLWRVLVRLQLPGNLLAAMIFALHPVGVESVAWITERKNVLAAVFYFASALAWLRLNPLAAGLAVAGRGETKDTTALLPPTSVPATPHRAQYWYVLSLAFFVCAMLSKTVAASLPAAMLLVTWWKRGRIEWRRDVRPLIPFFAIGFALAWNTALMERTRVGAIGPEWSFSVAERTLIAGRALWFYAAKLVWPVDLTFIYPRWAIDAGNWTQWIYPIGACVVVAGAFALRRRLGRGPLVAILFFGGTLVPALGFVNVYPMRFSFVADHFQYVASVGLIALAAAALSRIPMRASIALPLVLAALTWRQTGVYRDLETLWTSTLARNPSAWLAHNNLGNVLLDRGDADSAMAHYREAVRLKPDYYEALGNLGAALLRRGAVEEARTKTEEALRLAPGYTPALVNRAGILLRDGRPDDAIGQLQSVLSQEPENSDALNTLGSAFAMRGEVANAQRAFEAALRIRPQMVSARVNLARVLLRSGRIEEASLQLDQALSASPRDVDARIAKGQVLVARGRPGDAIEYYRRLAEELPGDASVRFNLATLLSQAGRTEDAISEFQAAVRLNPVHPESRNNLGIAFLISRRYAEAAEQFTEALRLRRQNPEAHNNLAYALIRLGRREEAIAHLNEALRLRPSYPEALAQLRALRR